MPGFELWGAEERKEVNDVLETGILMRYGFDGPRKAIWKAKELEAAICETFVLNMHNWFPAVLPPLRLLWRLWALARAMRLLCPALHSLPVLKLY
jgi:hypothetical protein